MTKSTRVSVCPTALLNVRPRLRGFQGNFPQPKKEFLERVESLLGEAAKDVPDWPGLFPGSYCHLANGMWAMNLPNNLESDGTGQSLYRNMVVGRFYGLMAQEPNQEELRKAAWFGIIAEASSTYYWTIPELHWIGVDNPGEFSRVARIAAAKMLSQKPENPKRVFKPTWNNGKICLEVID